MPAKFLAPLLSEKSGCVSGELLLLHQSAERAPNRKIITKVLVRGGSKSHTHTLSRRGEQNILTRDIFFQHGAHHYAQRKYKLWLSGVGGS
jgi:hypothetical protein